MEYIVRDCSNCGGWCCRCLVTAGEYQPFWNSVTPQQVSFYNPWLPSSVDLEKHQWATCRLLTSRGICIDYADRPNYCRSFPNFELFLEEYLSGLAFFYCPWCYYRAVILEMQGIPFLFCETGDECLERYLQDFKDDPTLAQQFLGPF